MAFPKIETWVPGQTGPGGPRVTERYATVWEARKARAEYLGLKPSDVAGRKVQR